MIYLGDFTEDSIVRLPFTTNDAAGGAIAPSSAFEAADIKIYKNGSATEKTSTNGLTMTSPYDAITGFHHLDIDTSNDTGDAGFWVAGADYVVALVPDETVDGQTITHIIGQFSIENRFDEVDVTKISGDATAADNLESQYDTTGLSGDTFPSTQSQLSGLANVGSAVNRPAASYTLTTGTQSANTVAATEALDGTNHEHTDDAGVLDLYYEFNIGAGLASSVQVTGYLNGNNDSVDIYGYDWVAAAWVQIGTLDGQASSNNQVNSYDLFVDMVGSGVNSGTVRIRFYAASGLTSATLAIDQVFTAFNQTAEGYQNAAVWFDSNASNTNTVVGVDGTATNPVSTMAAVNTLLASANLSRVEVIADSTVTLASSQNNQIFNGDRWTLALGGQDVSGTHFEGADVSGTSTGTEAHYHECTINTVSLSNSHITNSTINGPITLTATGDYVIANCHSGIAGITAPTIDMGAAVLNTDLGFRNYSGGIEILNLGAAGTDNVSIEGHGQVILNANCVAGTIAIRGAFELTNNGSGITISDEPRYDRATHVDDNWNEVLTAGAHNVNNSSGKILRLTKELGVYPEAAIYVDTVTGAAGTEDFENGTILNPVNNIADAKTLAVSLGFAKFIIATGSSITLASAFNNYYFTGSGWTIALGGQDIGGSTIERALVSGISTGSSIIHFRKCGIGTITVPPCHFHRCGIGGDITVGSAGNFTFDHSYSSVPGTGTPSFDFGAAIGDVGLNVRFQSGGLEIKNYNASGTDTMSLEGFGQLIVNANCTGGIIAIRGHFTITDNAGGAVTFSDDARFTLSGILDYLNATPIAELSAVPGSSPSFVEMLQFVYQYWKHRRTNTATQLLMYKENDVTVLGTGTISDDGTTFDKEEIS